MTYSEEPRPFSLALTQSVGNRLRSGLHRAVPQTEEAALRRQGEVAVRLHKTGLSGVLLIHSWVMGRLPGAAGCLDQAKSLADRRRVAAGDADQQAVASPAQ